VVTLRLELLAKMSGAEAGFRSFRAIGERSSPARTTPDFVGVSQVDGGGGAGKPRTKSRGCGKGGFAAR
jgi:hypothetical protein